MLKNEPVTALLTLTIAMPNLKFLASTIPDWDVRGSQNSKSGSRDPHMTPFNLILPILDISPRFKSVKFDVDSFIDEQYMATLRLRGFGCEMPIWANFGEFHYKTEHCLLLPWICVTVDKCWSKQKVEILGEVRTSKMLFSIIIIITCIRHTTTTTCNYQHTQTYKM